MLNNKLKLKDLGKPKKFLGVDFHCQLDVSLHMEEGHLIEKLLIGIGMLNAKPPGRPFGSNVFVNTANDLGIDAHQVGEYSSIVGTFMYLATRPTPDLTMAASMLVSYLCVPIKK